MADYDVEADLPALLEALCDRGDLVSVRAAEAIEHLRPKRKRRVCDDCIGRSDGEAVVCVHMLDTPVAPTSEQVRRALIEGWHRCPDTAPSTLDGMTDAVMGLIGGDDA